MKVLMMVRQYAPAVGGMETASHDLARALQQDGHEVTIVTSARVKATGETLVSREVIDGATVLRVPGWWNPLFIPRVNLNELPKSDVIHVQGIDGLVWLAWRASRRWGVPFLVTAHGAIFHTADHIRAKRLLWRTAFRALLARAAARLGDGENDRAAFEAIGLSCDVIPVGIHLPAITHRSRPIDLLYLGRLAAHKGLQDLLHTVREMRETLGHAVYAVVAGQDFDGTWNQVKAEAQALGIDYLGPVDEEEKWRLYGSAQVVAFPSRYEGFGIGVVEAMHAGAVVAVSPLSHAKDLVKDGVTGLHVPFHVPGAAARLLSRVLADRVGQEAMRPRAQSAAAAYDSRTTAKRIEEIYGDAIARYRVEKGVSI